MYNLFDHTMTPQMHAAYRMTEAQHAPGVTVRVNPDTFRVEYIRRNGSMVPGYSAFLHREYLISLYRSQLRAGRFITARKILCLLNFGLYVLRDDIETFQTLSTVPGLLDQQTINDYMAYDTCWVLLP